MTARAMRSAGHRRNPALWVITNPGGKLVPDSDREAISESSMLRVIQRELAAALDGRYDEHNTIVAVHDQVTMLLAQLSRGVHKNPGVSRGGTKFSDHVQAIVYEHVTEGPRVHGFGNADPDLKTRGDSLTMTGLHERTGAAMYAMPDGSILIRNTNGKPLWREDR